MAHTANMTNTAERLSTYGTKWNGKYSSIVLANAGYCYSGDGAIVECKACNVKVNTDETNVISVRHDTNCQIEKELRKRTTYPGTIFASPISQVPTMQPGVLELYPSLESIMTAPDKCLCSTCNPGIIELPRFTIDAYGCRRITPVGLLLSLKDRLEQMGPVHSFYDDLTTRMNTFPSGVENVDEPYVDVVSEAGFFCSGQQGRQNVCFCCGLSICRELLLTDPWREHARWVPVCPYVVQKKTENFIHGVIKETGDLKRYYKGLNRPSRMETEVVMEAQKADFPPNIITDVIQHFFADYGSFPKQDELFYILKQRWLWKTSPVQLWEDEDLLFQTI